MVDGKFSLAKPSHHAARDPELAEFDQEVGMMNPCACMNASCVFENKWLP
jgi:hypothetical protein